MKKKKNPWPSCWGYLHFHVLLLRLSQYYVEHTYLVAQSQMTFCNCMDCSPPGCLCPWNFPSKNTGVGCHFLLQGIFPNQGSSLISYIFCIASRFFTTEPSGKPMLDRQEHLERAVRAVSFHSSKCCQRKTWGFYKMSKWSTHWWEGH